MCVVVPIRVAVVERQLRHDGDRPYTGKRSEVLLQLMEEIVITTQGSKAQNICGLKTSVHLKNG